ncbi:MAG: SDR family NAD(P)-dependent oxidoreductase [Phycisphaerales bacterium]|nr:SDR family NAD(P)-dependent oxidoreductase [Phycisphaerales bacterium]
MPKYELIGRTVLLTGATGGLGAALAKELRARGANLALLDLDTDATGKQADELGGSMVARGWRADVRDLESLKQAAAAAAEYFGRIDVVLAIAGIDTMGPMATIDPEAFERVIDINLTGVWRTFRATLPHVQAQQGYLMAISSMAAFVHSPLQGSYTASKAGVWAMCDSIRLELRHLDVAVGSVHPTFFQTPMMDDVLNDPAGQTLWGGNKKGLWKMVPQRVVINGIVKGIERRATTIVLPKRNTIVAKAPGLFRPIVDRIGFRGTTIPSAISLASPTGLNEPPNRDRAQHLD